MMKAVYIVCYGIVSHVMFCLASFGFISLLDGGLYSNDGPRLVTGSADDSAGGRLPVFPPVEGGTICPSWTLNDIIRSVSAPICVHQSPPAPQQQTPLKDDLRETYYSAANGGESGLSEPERQIEPPSKEYLPPQPPGHPEQVDGQVDDITKRPYVVVAVPKIVKEGVQHKPVPDLTKNPKEDPHPSNSLPEASEDSLEEPSHHHQDKVTQTDEATLRSILAQESSVTEDMLEAPSEDLEVVEEDNKKDDIVSFRQWAEKQNTDTAAAGQKEAEKYPYDYTQNQQKPSPSKLAVVKLTKNFASPDCTAKVMGANPEAQGSGNVITGSRDEYLLNKCTDKAWFVVELCESIKALKVQLANFELYSSSPKDFRVSISNVYPGREKDWVEFGTFTYDDERSLQSFKNEDGVVGKYAKVEVLSHHGSEHYCPVSLFRVFGISEIDLITEEDEDDEEEDDLHRGGASFHSVEEEEEKAVAEVNPIVKSVKTISDAVVSVLRNVVYKNSQNLSLEMNLSETSLTGATMRHNLRPASSFAMETDRRNIITYLLASQYANIREYLYTMSVRSVLFSMCPHYGIYLSVDEDESNKCTSNQSIQWLNLLKTIHGEDFILALCNILSIELGQSDLAGVASLNAPHHQPLGGQSDNTSLAPDGNVGGHQQQPSNVGGGGAEHRIQVVTNGGAGGNNGMMGETGGGIWDATVNAASPGQDNATPMAGGDSSSGQIRIDEGGSGTSGTNLNNTGGVREELAASKPSPNQPGDQLLEGGAHTNAGSPAANRPNGAGGNGAQVNERAQQASLPPGGQQQQALPGGAKTAPPGDAAAGGAPPPRSSTATAAKGGRKPGVISPGGGGGGSGKIPLHMANGAGIRHPLPAGGADQGASGANEPASIKGDYQAAANDNNGGPGAVPPGRATGGGTNGGGGGAGGGQGQITGGQTNQGVLVGEGKSSGRETTWQKLSNRIKALERNVSLSTGFLEELSIKYIKQIDELNSNMRAATESIAHLQKREDACITKNVHLQQKVEDLSQLLDLVDDKIAGVQEEVMSRHGLLMLLETLLLLLFLYWCQPVSKQHKAFHTCDNCREILVPKVEHQPLPSAVVTADRQQKAPVRRKLSLDTAVNNSKKVGSSKMTCVGGDKLLLEVGPDGGREGNDVKRRKSIEIGSLCNGSLAKNSLPASSLSGSRMDPLSIQNLTKKQRKRRRQKEDKLKNLRNVEETFDEDSYRTYHGKQEMKNEESMRKRSNSWSEDRDIFSRERSADNQDKTNRISPKVIRIDNSLSYREGSRHQHELTSPSSNRFKVYPPRHPYSTENAADSSSSRSHATSPARENFWRETHVDEMEEGYQQTMRAPSLSPQAPFCPRCKSPTTTTASNEWISAQPGQGPRGAPNGGECHKCELTLSRGGRTESTGNSVRIFPKSRSSSRTSDSCLRSYAVTSSSTGSPQINVNNIKISNLYGILNTSVHEPDTEEESVNEDDLELDLGGLATNNTVEVLAAAPGAGFVVDRRRVGGGGTDALRRYAGGGNGRAAGHTVAIVTANNGVHNECNGDDVNAYAGGGGKSGHASANSKYHRSKSTSPTRHATLVARQKVMFKNFKPENADWLHPHQ